MGANPLSIIRRCYPDLNTTERLLANYVLDNPVDTSRLPIDYLSEELGVSKSTIVRFAQKLGFAGFATFKQELARQLLSHQDEDSDDQAERPAEQIAEAYARYLDRMSQGLRSTDMARLARLVCGADRILAIGYDRTFHAARQLCERLANVGVRAHAIDDPAYVREAYSLYTASDLLVVFTVADTSKHIAPTVRFFAESGAPIVCITCAKALPFRKLCQEYVVLPRISHDTMMTFLDDEALFLVFIEILIDAVAKQLDEEQDLT